MKAVICFDFNVFPAHAGMSPSHSPPTSERKSFPRTRGDEPYMGTYDYEQQ